MPALDQAEPAPPNPEPAHSGPRAAHNPENRPRTIHLGSAWINCPGTRGFGPDVAARLGEDSNVTWASTEL